VTVDGVAYGQGVRFSNDRLAEVSFAHRTGLTYTYGSYAGIVNSLPGKPYRDYIIAYLSNLGYRYEDQVFADRKSHPYLDPVAGITYTQRIPSLGQAIDEGLRKASLATPPGLPPFSGGLEILTGRLGVPRQALASSSEPIAPFSGPPRRDQPSHPHPPGTPSDARLLRTLSSGDGQLEAEDEAEREGLSLSHRSGGRLVAIGRPWEEVVPPIPLATT
jgi:hypothetical protein